MNTVVGILLIILAGAMVYFESYVLAATDVIFGVVIIALAKKERNGHA